MRCRWFNRASDFTRAKCMVCFKDIMSHDSCSHMNEIISHLFLGGECNAYNLRELIYFKIQMIVNVATFDTTCLFYDAGFEYLRYG